MLIITEIGGFIGVVQSICHPFATAIFKIITEQRKGSEHAEQSADSLPIFVRARPCFTLWSFSLIRKTELWKTNKPPAMQVSQHCFSLQKKTSGGIINVGSPTALIYTGGIHMDNNSLSHTKVQFTRDYTG